MARFGIIFTAFNMEQYVGASIAPWAKAREEKWGGHEYVICAVCCPFKSFEVQTFDNTLAILQKWMGAGAIDCVISKDEAVQEIEARGEALKWLMNNNIDYSIQFDADEFITKEQIENITRFVTRSPATWFKLSYKNYVFNDKTFMTEPFTPGRIHRIKTFGFEANRFWDDNNVAYKNLVTGEEKLDRDLACVTIPKTVAFVKHLTWLSDDRSRRKCEYQTKRWGASSFAWDKEKGLVWNESYFASKGLPLPEIESE